MQAASSTIIHIGHQSRAFIRLARLFVAALALTAAPAFAKSSRIEATYSIKWLGLPVGSFAFTSQMTNRTYALNARAHIGMIEWDGTTQSSGAITPKGPSPVRYEFRYSAGQKAEQVNMRFASNTVEELRLTPPLKPNDRRVPVTRSDMQNVIDPLSAVVTLSTVGKQGGDVCRKKLPIFDGKQRYDLTFFRKAEKEVDTGEGYKGKATVCGVKFTPIAGHKLSKDEKPAFGDGIEVWMIPAETAELYVPYYIVVPTPFGNASMTASKFNIETSEAGRKALIR